MTTGKPSGTGIGSIVLESIMVIEIAIELYTGEMTWTELCWMLILCVLLAITIFLFLRKKR